MHDVRRTAKVARERAVRDRAAEMIASDPECAKLGFSVVARGLRRLIRLGVLVNRIEPHGSVSLDTAPDAHELMEIAKQGL